MDNSKGDCLIWSGAKSKEGYGHTKLHGVWIDIHRFVAYCTLFKDDSEIEQARKLLVRHRCDNPPCIVPKHLIFGTKSSNAYDAIARGTWNRGQASSAAKLSDEDVTKIRAYYAEGNVTQKVLAQMFGVTQSNISYIVTGASRRD